MAINITQREKGITTGQGQIDVVIPPPNPIKAAAEKGKQLEEQLNKLDNATLEDARAVADMLKLSIGDDELQQIVATANDFARKGKAKGTAMDAVDRRLRQKFHEQRAASQVPSASQKPLL